MNKNNLKEFLEKKYEEFNCPSFIEKDPVQIPHLFSKKNDIEIAGFLTSVISWGQRKSILRNAHKMMSIMDNSPYEFILNHTSSDLKKTEGFVHRTFKNSDLIFFITSLNKLLLKHGSLENFFTSNYLKENSLKNTIIKFRAEFLETKHEKYTERHVPNILKGSAAKRMNMFLRWMIRKDNNGVDFGCWENIPPSSLYIPLDVHTAKIGRDLRLLKRKSNDWKAVEEFTDSLRVFDSRDPIKYDLALFSIGVNNDNLT